MDVAIPLREGATDSHPIIWMLRSMERHYSPMKRVFIIGGAPPPGLDPDFVIHVPVPQSSTKFVNIGNNVLATIESEIEDEFLWTNDDIFFLRDMEEIPLYCRTYTFDPFVRRIQEVLKRAAQAGKVISRDFNDYLRGMIGQRDILQAWGYKDHPLTDIHTPVVLRKDRLMETFERVSREFPEHELGHFRALYAAGLPAVPFADHKLQKATGLPPDDATFVSINGKSWGGEVGDWLRERFSSVSKYERRVVGS